MSILRASVFTAHFCPLLLVAFVMTVAFPHIPVKFAVSYKSLTLVKV